MLNTVHALLRLMCSRVKYLFSRGCRWHEAKVNSNWLVTRKKKEGINGSQTENSRDNFRHGWIQVLSQRHQEAICPSSRLVFSVLALCVNTLSCNDKDDSISFRVMFY